MEFVDVKYKNNKRYNTAKYPIRQPIYLSWLIWVLSKFSLIGKKYKIDKVDMDNLKAPYMILSNHMCFLDFELLAVGLGIKRVNNVVNLDGYYQRAWLMRWIGSVPTRKFNTDINLVKSIFKVLSRKDILCMYPEARYSPCGIQSYIPDSVGALVKKSKVDVVAVVHRGNHLFSPFWNFRKKRKVPFHTTITKILTVEQINELSIDEINKRIQEALTYNDYQYQLDNNILIKEKYRAEGLHKILYKCPHCNIEGQMDSKDEFIYCKYCNKKWRLKENGMLQALNGETKFVHIPDWFNWERNEVEKEIYENKYYFTDDCDVYSFPSCYKFQKLGKAKITHDSENGFVLTGNYNNADYTIIRKPFQINGLHVEYDYFRIRRADCFVINTENDSFFCYPTKENVVTKLAFATEIIHLRKLKLKRNK